uniref:hypothetical protein n=1 Tax=Thermogutta sp. TaxID=1962930 RepID=UPI0032209A41
DQITAARGAGDLFLDDVYTHFLDINGQNVWARGLNMEHGVDFQNDECPRPNTINNGGNLWVLGLKTEQPRTKVRNVNRAKSEIYGYILANTGLNPLPMFENYDSSISISIVESVLRRAPFEIILQSFCGGVSSQGDRAMLGAQGSEGAAVPLMTASCSEK